MNLLFFFFWIWMSIFQSQIIKPTKEIKKKSLRLQTSELSQVVWSGIVKHTLYWNKGKSACLSNLPCTNTRRTRKYSFFITKSDVKLQYQCCREFSNAERRKHASLLFTLSKNQYKTNSIVPFYICTTKIFVTLLVQVHRNH